MNGRTRKLGRSIRIGATILMFAVLCSDATAQLARLEKSDWQAQWIWRPGEQYGNAWIAFRKTFDLPGDPAEAMANIAVDSKYWLWVNGELVVREGGLKRGPTPTDTYYDTVELAPYLQSGSNTIAILVWYWGRSGFSHVDSGKGGLLFEANADGTLIKSDETWISRRHPAFGWTDAPVPNGRLPEYNVMYDGRRDMTGWMNPSFDAGSWEPAVVQANPPGGPWHRLFQRPIPQWRDSDLLPYLNQPDLPFDANGDTLAFDLPYNAHMTPYFRIEAPEGLTVDMRTDHYTTTSIDGVTKIYSVRTEYITEEGVQEFETPAWMSGEAVHYHFPAGVRVLDVKYRETSYDSEFEGWFTSSDDLLDRLWIKARRTVAVSMRDYFMETADRERKQATGDGSLAILSALYSFDERVQPLIRKFWSEFEAWRTNNGVFLSGVPGNWDIELSQQNLFAFGDLGLWNYYLHTGDIETVRSLYPAIKSYLLLWNMDSSGLVMRRETGWNWYDWGVNIDEPLIENAWYYLALRGAAKIAQLVGRNEDLPEWNRRMDSLKEAYNRVLWDGHRYHTEGQYGEPDDRGNALAVLADFPTPAMRGHLNRLLRSEYHASPYMENFVDAALFHLGDADAAIQRMKDRYCQMVESDYSTLWEFWDPRVASKSHQFGTGTLRTLSYYVGGIQPTEAGFRRMRIAPMIGSLDWVDAGVPTKEGIVSVRVETNRRPPQGVPALAMRVTIPEGSTAIVGVPLVSGVLSHIEVAGRIVWQDDRGVVVVDGVRPIDMTLTHVNFEVRAGTWEFLEYLKPAPAQFDGVKVYPVRDRKAVLRWQASDQLDDIEYVVQERLNEEFESIATLNGSGVSQEAQDYEHEIPEVTPGVHTYRVMAKSSDGCLVYSDVVRYEVPMERNLVASQIYPNPMNAMGHVVIGVEEAQRVRLEIVNAVGQRVAVLADQYMIPEEQYRFTLESARLPAGAYALFASGEKTQAARRFVVVH
jgi:hypothetical protein